LPENQEIIDFFAKGQSNVCGRFYEKQMKSYALPSPIAIQPGWPLLRAGLLAIGLLAAAKSSYGQINAAETTVSPVTSEKADHPQSQIIEVSVTGVVLDENDLPMPGVSVLLAGTTTGTVTDADGRFHLLADLSRNDKLVFSFIGYHSVVHVISPDRYNDLEIRITMAYVELMGAVAVEGLYEKKENIWTKFKNLF
jgi:hypothetical protein